MVKDPRAGGPKLPEPNFPQQVLVPAPEGDPDLFTTVDPVELAPTQPCDQSPPEAKGLGKPIDPRRSRQAANPAHCEFFRPW